MRGRREADRGNPRPLSVIAKPFNTVGEGLGPPVFVIVTPDDTSASVGEGLGPPVFVIVTPDDPSASVGEGLAPPVFVIVTPDDT